MNYDMNLPKYIWGDYKRMLTWSFTKSINDEDKFDWKYLSTIMENKGDVICAYGDMDSLGDIKFHSEFVGGQLIDGNGLFNNKDDL